MRPEPVRLVLSNNANSEIQDTPTQRKAKPVLVHFVGTHFLSDPTVRIRSSGTGLNLSDWTSTTQPQS